MSTILIAVFGTFILVIVVSYLLFSVLSPKKTDVEKRLEDLAGARASHGGEDLMLDTSRQQESGILKSVGAMSSALPVSLGTQSKYRSMLVQAGYRKTGALAVFIGFKLVLGMVFFLVLFLYTISVRHDPTLATVLGILGFIAGLMVPNVWLTEKLKKRQTDIFHSLPDVLDLMTVCVEAGLGLDAAIIKISEEKQFSRHVLSGEFRTVSQEIRAGKARIDALRDLGNRTGVDDIKALTALLIQTEKLGASLARSLRVHSDSLRTKRRQMAEEAAAKTSIKLIFPLAFFIFPALMVVLLGPAVIRIYQTLVGSVIK